MPGGGLTVFSCYSRSSQGSCHDICKYGTNISPATESKTPRSPMRKIVVAKRGEGWNLERVSECNLVDRRKKTGFSVQASPDFKILKPDDLVIKVSETQRHHVENVEDSTNTKNSAVSVMNSNDAKLKKPEYPSISLKPSWEDPVDIEGMEVESKAKDEEYVGTISPKGEKSQQFCVKPSPDSESQKPANPDCIEGEVSSWTDKESVLPEQVLLYRKETDDAVARAKDSNLNPQSKPSSLIRQTRQSGKQNSEGPKRKEANIIPTISLGVSGGRNKGEMTISKGIRSSIVANKKNVLLPSVSLSRKESGTGVSSMNAMKKKLRVVYHLNQENEKQIKLKKLHGTNAERSGNLKGDSQFLDLENVKKFNSEQVKSANIAETTPYLTEPNPENKPAESDQNNVVSMRPSSSSKDKSMKHNHNKIPISRLPRSYEKKKMMYRPKGIQASGFPPSLSLSLGRKSLRPTPNGLKITQPSLTSLPSLTCLESFYNDNSTENDKALVENKKGSSKMMYKAKPKRALMITSINKHLPGKKLDFQRAKAIEFLVKDHTARRLAFKKREPVDNKNDDNRRAKVEDCTPRRLKLRQRVNADNINGDNQNSRFEEFTPRRLKFRQRVIIDNRKGDNRNSRVKEFTPKRVKLRQRVVVDDRKGDNQNNRVQEFTPNRFKFRQRVIFDNRNGDNENGEVKEFTPRRLKFRRRVSADNRNDDNQKSRTEELPTWTLKFRKKIIVDNMNAENQNVDDQNGRGEDSAPTKLIFRPKVVVEKKTGSSENNTRGKKADIGIDNGTKIKSEKVSLRHRDANEKKGSGILYNNIIEQTASKLAETKASKVKALVSAFETVISHLDIGISETNDGN
ncbi:hypothetical protein F3Y22_tig00111723pilonHSYRG00079 [Hibiscus syriacus]|uniref:Calmodulin-binding domain-containing protein n=1 Tax=Hibiscus syriacus TaxID=106335 RepID=A0A6A2YI15_HIBSY|nr:hypothetical protein F3Y22_tig00111723pilonHSYRG00079 [Hibiscus syriacus]